jgi:DNA-binding Lrp family transcriptional regulator
MARALGVSAGTIRNRVRGMTDTGFLQGMMSYVNPNALGLSAAAYTIEVAPTLSKETVIRRLSRVEGVIFFENFRGNLLGIGLLGEAQHDLDRSRARIDRIARSTPVLLTRVPFPPCTGRLTSQDWETVRSLMKGDRRGYSELARELKVSIRTVKRRIARLVGIGAMFTFPRMDYRRISGGVTAELLVTYRDPVSKVEAEPRIRHLLEDRLTFVGPWEDFDMYRLILPNVALLDVLTKEIASLPGVRGVRGEFVDQVIDRFETLRPYLERHLRATRAQVKLAPTA